MPADILIIVTMQTLYGEDTHTRCVGVSAQTLPPPAAVAGSDWRMTVLTAAVWRLANSAPMDIIAVVLLSLQSAAADTPWPDPRPVPVSVTMIITAARFWEMRPTSPVLGLKSAPV